VGLWLCSAIRVEERRLRRPFFSFALEDIISPKGVSRFQKPTLRSSREVAYISRKVARASAGSDMAHLSDRTRCFGAVQHPLYALGGTTGVLALAVATTARDYRQQSVRVS
jgi:hypothetical protein